MRSTPSSEVDGGDALERFYEALLDDDAAELYERAPCGYLSTTPDGTIIKVNGTFLTLTGYDRPDLVGKRMFVDLLSAGGRIYHETHYAPMLQMQGRAREIALELVRADGSRLPTLVNSVLERDDEGEPCVIRSAVFDATERREYERELLRAKERAEDSERRTMLLARTLQQTLIPPSPPDIPGLDIAAAYRPAGTGAEVGGDFYDVFEVSEGDWVVAIGDVRGKGAEAAVVTALARYTIRAAAVRQPSPAQVLSTVNEMLCRDGTDRFCTAAVIRLREADHVWTATISVGGHPLPLRWSGGDVHQVGRAGQLLGVFSEPRLHDVTLGLEPSEALVLYTDGVTEGRRGGDFFGDERLRRSIAEHSGSAAGITDGVVADVLAFQAGNARDDIAVVAVRRPAA